VARPVELNRTPHSQRITRARPRKKANASQETKQNKPNKPEIADQIAHTSYPASAELSTEGSA
jgi:hypothetical protein